MSATFSASEVCCYFLDIGNVIVNIPRTKYLGDTHPMAMSLKNKRPCLRVRVTISHQYCVCVWMYVWIVFVCVLRNRSV